MVIGVGVTHLSLLIPLSMFWYSTEDRTNEPRACYILYECKTTLRHYMLVISHTKYTPTVKELDPSETPDPFERI